MPLAERVKLVSASHQSVWRYVLQMDQWLVHLDGYRGHEMQPDGQILLQLRGDVGAFAKTTSLLVCITEQKEPVRLAFSLRSESDPITGGGQLLLTPLPSGGTKLEFSLELGASGMAAPVVNALLGKILNTAIDGLAQEVVRELEAASS